MDRQINQFLSFVEVSPDVYTLRQVSGKNAVNPETGNLLYYGSYAAFPKLWVERLLSTVVDKWWARLLVFSPIGLIIEYGLVNVGLVSRLSLFTVFGVLTCLGEALDVLTTDLFVRHKPIFDRQGWDYPVIEGNRLLPRTPTVRQHLLSLPTAGVIGVIAVSYYVPGISAMVAVVKLMASWSNYRKYQRINHIVEFLRRKTPLST